MGVGGFGVGSGQLLFPKFGGSDGKGDMRMLRVDGYHVHWRQVAIV